MMYPYAFNLIWPTLDTSVAIPSFLFGRVVGCLSTWSSSLAHRALWPPPVVDLVLLASTLAGCRLGPLHVNTEPSITASSSRLVPLHFNSAPCGRQPSRIKTWDSSLCLWVLAWALCMCHQHRQGRDLCVPFYKDQGR